MVPLISLLVCTYQGPASLDYLLDSFENQEWQKGDEFILVDNGIQEERLSQVRQRLNQLSLTGIRAIYAKEEQTGLTAARMHGFSLLSNDWVVLLDDDNQLGSNALSQLRKRIALNPGLGGICPRVEPIWEVVPEPSVRMMGHDILSYNTSDIYKAPFDFKEWPGGVRGLRPPGGGMMVHRSATDAFMKLCLTHPFLFELGHSGKSLGSGEDYVIYEQVYRAGRPTAYDGSILVMHRIPAHRLPLQYLCRLFFRANYGFGLVALMILGKGFFLPSIAHAILRLTRRFISGGKNSVSWKVLLAFLFAFAGYVGGSWEGLMRRDLPNLRRMKS